MAAVGELRERVREYAAASEDPSGLADAAHRLRKAEKIRAVLRDARILPGTGLRLLDIGASYGYILQGLAGEVALGVGIDVDSGLPRQAGPNIAYATADGERLPFADESFDVVVCNHVYEHTEDAARLFSEILRVLRPGGACYFSGPNKYALIEPHYLLPFLSWLPRPLAHAYMRATGRGKRYLWRPKSLGELRRLLERFQVVDYSGRLVEDPLRFAMEDLLRPGSLAQRIAIAVHRHLPGLFPGYVFLLRKR